MFVTFFVLLSFGVPLGFTLGFLAVVFGYIAQGNSIFTFALLRTWGLMNMFSLIAIPLFIFMANMLRVSGMVDDLYGALYRWLGPVRGGLAIATVLV
ncbi:unnamed protein product, partial [marine sediment metagenome]